MDKEILLTELNETPSSFLKEAYRTLGYEEGVLLDAVAPPLFTASEIREWLDKGDWLALAHKVGAKKVFFVKDDPVIVFCEHQDPHDVRGIIKAFRQAWCMARPTCLFLALPGELRVYSLNNTPARNTGDWKRIQPLAVAYRIAEVAEKLHAFRREEVESGRLFADKRFGDINERADKRLIQDLKSVRQSLLDAGLAPRYAHALIGRSIFVRYLEDRGVLIPRYFEKVAEGQPTWQELLSEPPEKPALMLDLEERRYHCVLRNKDFTYTLFRQLAEHFNGDLFPKDENEEQAVNEEHLAMLRQFLLGERDSGQLSLFFWAYHFAIIPIELVSSIYEEFYHENNEDDKGTHYTPSVLVEFILSNVLKPELLARSPKVLDPACGSGIFLVEAFRRIVRYNVQQRGRPLSSKELRNILRTQISGIEINREATRVAAFSLYLALLHYQEPPDILAQIEASKESGKPLPYLVYESTRSQDESHYHIIYNTDSFGLMDEEREQLKNKLTKAKFAGRAEVSRLYNSDAVLPLVPNSFDVIVGNPPWGFKKGTTQEIQQTQEQAQRWCDVFGWPIGDKELSQAFIARTLSLIKPRGKCGLLISTGVFLKHQENSRKFRQQWLRKCIIKTVVNFAHVRDIFFSSAIAPFAYVLYEADSPDPMHWVHYWSAKKTIALDKVQAVILRLPDLRQVRQSDFVSNESLWKVYWWGSHRDATLISSLNANKKLGQVVDERGWKKGQGYTPGSVNSRGWLKDYKELPIEFFTRYGVVREDVLTGVPAKVHRRGIRELFSGWRILIKRGITQAQGTNGRIEARLDNLTFCFRNSIHAVELGNAEDWERKVLIGILWSSLARYYFFTTASSWGTWHHEIHLEEVLSLPVRFPSTPALREMIVRIVDELRNSNLSTTGFTLPYMEGADREISQLEQKLDEAIFELYELSEPERDLILDMCELGLEFFYRRDESSAINRVEQRPESAQGFIGDLPTRREYERGLEGYLYSFLQVWNRELVPEGEFSWHVLRPADVPMVAVVFATQEKGTLAPPFPQGEIEEWEWVLERCEAALFQPISKSMYIDGIVRAVTDTEIIIMKRDEQWLWTRSMAREDAEATLLQAVHLQQVAKG